jgi:hypothetical protein
LGRRVAVKVRHLPEGPLLAGCARDSFVTEARAAAQVCHPNVVSVFDFGVEGRLAYLVMELVEGETLAQLLAREGRLGVPRSLDVLLPILSAVADVHTHGIIHRDIKPANILLGWAGVTAPKLSDFGISRFVEDYVALTESATVRGTPGYMAPEARRSPGDVDERGDQYALGVVLYECLTGARPFVGDTGAEPGLAVRREAVMPPSRFDPSVPGRLDSVVMRAMHPERSERFGSIDEFAEALLTVAPAGARIAWERQSEPSWSGRRAVAESSHVDGAAEILVSDGVALSLRGDAMCVLWRAPATMTRIQWLFDMTDRLLPRRPDGIVVLVVILPTSHPPDYAGSLECIRRLRTILPSVRRQSTVALGGAVWQRVVLSVHRAMNLPVRPRNRRWTISATLETGIARLMERAGSMTPSLGEVRGDVLALYDSLHVPESERPLAV